MRMNNVLNNKAKIRPLISRAAPFDQFAVDVKASGLRRMTAEEIAAKPLSATHLKHPIALPQELTGKLVTGNREPNHLQRFVRIIQRNTWADGTVDVIGVHRAG